MKEIKENTTIQKINNPPNQNNKVNIKYIPRSNKQQIFYLTPKNNAVKKIEYN